MFACLFFFFSILATKQNREIKKVIDIVIKLSLLFFLWRSLRYWLYNNLNCALSFYHKNGMILKAIVRLVHLYNRSFRCCVQEMATTVNDYNENIDTVQQQRRRRRQREWRLSWITTTTKNDGVWLWSQEKLKTVFLWILLVQNIFVCVLCVYCCISCVSEWENEWVCAHYADDCYINRVHVCVYVTFIVYTVCVCVCVRA